MSNNPFHGNAGTPSHEGGSDTVFIGGGEMGRLMRAIDWSKTAFGPVEHWSQALKRAVLMMLSSKAQICLFWGPAFNILYNDAYREVLATKHPQVLATPGWVCWEGIWDDLLGPLLNQVIETGEAFWAQDHPFYLQRPNFIEETYFDVSYDPIRDESGNVGGVFCIVSDQTRRVLTERRLNAFRLLTTHTSLSKTVEAAAQGIMETLAQMPKDIPFALLYLMNSDNQGAHLLAHSGIAPDTLNSLTEATWGMNRGLLIRENVIVRRLEDYFVSIPLGIWPERPHTALVLPLADPSHDKMTGFLVCGISPRLHFDNDYKDFLTLIAGHIAAVIANAQREEEERRRIEALAELDRAKNELFSNVSREFRTPLTLLINPLQDLLRDSTLNDNQQAIVTLAHRNASQLLELINSLDGFSDLAAESTEVPAELEHLSRLRAQLLTQEQRSRQQVEQILESITDAFYSLDFHWRLTYVNQMMARDLKMSVAELIGKNIWEIFPMSVGSPAYYALHRVMMEREPMQFETINYRGNNWLEVSAHPAENGISVYYRDISQRVRAERQIRLLQEVTAALTAAYTLDEVAEVIINRTLFAIEADEGVIGLVNEDGQTIELLRQKQLSESAKSYMKLPLKAGSGLFADTVLQGKPFWFSEQQEFLDAYPNYADVTRNEFQIHAIASLPLYTHQRVIGAMLIVFVEPRHPTPEEQTFLVTLADYCAQALERALLYEAERRARNDAEQATIRIARLQLITEQLAESLNSEEVAEVILHEGLETVGAKAGSIFLLSKDEKSLEIIGIAGYPSATMARWRNVSMDASNLPLTVCVRQQEAIWLRSPEDRLAQGFAPPKDDTLPEFQAWAALPLIVNGICLGGIGLSFDKPQPFDASQRRFAMSLAEQCAQALERTRLRVLARDAAALEERQRLARDLHDSVSQVLYSATNTAEAIPRLLERNPKRAREELEQLIILNRAAMAEMRTLLLELRPEAIVRTPLKQLLDQLVRALQGRKTIVVDANLGSDQEWRLPPEVHVAFYRIAQEAINNVVKHSEATQLTLRLSDQPDTFSMEIIDNGQGFDIEQPSIGLGMTTMRERALEIGAIFNLHSATSEGTRVALEWAKQG